MNANLEHQEPVGSVRRDVALGSDGEACSALTSEAYVALWAEFASFAAVSEHAPLWRALLVEATHTELPPEQVVGNALVILRDRETVKTYFPDSRLRVIVHSNKAEIVLGLTNPIDELWDFATRLSYQGRLALDILIRRAIDPLEALATWPLSALFEKEEIAWLQSTLEVVTELQGRRIEWSPGTDIRYDGYICVICKFTRLCNLRCTYCHDWRSGKNQKMSFHIQAELFHKLLSRDNHNVIDVVWHGGEPTLLGRREFLRILALQRWFRRPGQRIRNIIQTNATTLDGSWVNFFRRYHFRVGVSIDGPPPVHDQTRPHSGGRGSFEAVQRGLRLLCDSGLLGGVLLVVSKSILEFGAERIVRFLQEEGITQVGMLPVRPANGRSRTNEYYLDHVTYIEFLLEVERARRKSPDPPLHVRELDGALKALEGLPAGHCELLGNCIGAFFTVDIDGSVAHCDKYVGDEDYTLGNIANNTFAEIRAGDRTQHLRSNTRVSVEKKQGCPYFAYCRGWCPHEQYIAHLYDPQHDASCCGLSTLFETLKGEMDG